MKSLTIVTTWGTKYWPNPVQPGLKSTIENWPEHAKVLAYPDDMSQQLDLPRTQYFDLCKEQPVLKEFIERNKDNPRLTKWQPQQYKFEYDAIRFSYKVFACIDAYQKTKPDMLWFLDADIITFEKIPMSWLEHIIPDSAFTSYLGRPKKGFPRQDTTLSTLHTNMQTNFSKGGSSTMLRIYSLTYKKDS